MKNITKDDNQEILFICFYSRGSNIKDYKRYKDILENLVNRTSIAWGKRPGCPKDFEL